VKLLFIETTQFTKRITADGWENDLRELQQELLGNPEKGPLEPGTGGLRKVRMRLKTRGKGKSSGARVHYVYLPHRAIIYLLFVYPKGEQPVLTDEQKKRLRPLIDGFKHGH
jgi:hypothetical protein